MSWIAVSPQSSFPIQNLPYGVFSRKMPISPETTATLSQSIRKSIGVAIGDYVLDLSRLVHAGIMDHLSFDAHSVLLEPSLNGLMALDRSKWSELRKSLTDLLDDVTTDTRLRDNSYLREKALIPLNEIDMHLPAVIGDYTDFYSSREHATNIGIMLRGKDNALQPNWLHLPVGYHGRASSVVVSGLS